MHGNSNIYNKHFDNATNCRIDELVKRSPNKQLPRINRKNGESVFDAHLGYILEKLKEKKTQSQILCHLNFRFNLGKTKSSISRFIAKKLGGLDDQSK
jgi:hypothetical protein